jgi:hypothetical protein
MTLPLLLLACADPFLNDPPRLISVNDVALERVQSDDLLPDWAPGLRVTPGERFEVRVELVDPDGDTVDVWWPRSPRGWSFEPDATNGYWDVPSDWFLEAPLELILRDDDPETPRSTAYEVPLWSD